jgi:hypothetical protein
LAILGLQRLLLWTREGVELMTWLPWILLAIVTAMFVVEALVGRYWRRVAIGMIKQCDSLAAELEFWKRTRGQS